MPRAATAHERRAAGARPLVARRFALPPPLDASASPLLRDTCAAFAGVVAAVLVAVVALTASGW